MTAIERTAYPTFNILPLYQQELDEHYTPTNEEIHFIQNKLRRNPDSISSNYAQCQLNAITLLKCFQRLGHFPSLRTVPKMVVDHIRHHLQLDHSTSLWYKHSQVLYRHQAIIRTYLNVKSYLNGGKEIAAKIAIESAKVHNYPADIINCVLEELMHKRYELPAYSQIDRLVKQLRLVLTRKFLIVFTNNFLIK
jgi:Domain of unknown function (DUF4158)